MRRSQPPDVLFLVVIVAGLMGVARPTFADCAEPSECFCNYPPVRVYARTIARTANTFELIEVWGGPFGKPLPPPRVPVNDAGAVNTRPVDDGLPEALKTGDLVTEDPGTGIGPAEVGSSWLIALASSASRRQRLPLNKRNEVTCYLTKKSWPIEDWLSKFGNTYCAANANIEVELGTCDESVFCAFDSRRNARPSVAPALVFVILGLIRLFARRRRNARTT